MLSKLPPARIENIVVQDAGDEVLIYDLITNKAFCLNETSAIIYQACDGKTSSDELKAKYHFSDDLIFFALDELKKEKLIEDNYVSPFKGIKRREVIKKIGLASMIALPVIVSLMAPTAVMAAASCGGASPAGTILGCTATEQSCLAMFQMCASCSTSAVIMIGAGACDAQNPFLCTCD